MKKILLSFGLLLVALGASAQMNSVGASIEILPSTYYGSTAEGCCWTAKTWLYNTATTYNGYADTTSPDFNVVWGVPNNDNNGKAWYEYDFDVDNVEYAENTHTGEEINWEEHSAPFTNAGSYSTQNAGTVTTTYVWTDDSVMADFYLRRSFIVDMNLSGDVYLSCGHDDSPCEYYLNGTLIWSRTGWESGNGWDESAIYKLEDDQKALFYTDGVTENILAVHVHQNWGGAFADCGFYMKGAGGIDMGYVTPWDGKTMFNSCGGYIGNMDNTPNPAHGWELLYEAQADDAYTIYPTVHDDLDDGDNLLQFKTPIDIQSSHSYTFTATLNATVNMRLKVRAAERDASMWQDDEDESIFLLNDDLARFNANTDYVYTGTFTGRSVDNLTLAFDLYGPSADPGEDYALTISKMSLIDNNTGEELWIGTHYFNYMNFRDQGQHTSDPVLEGRVETLAWTLPDFDDSMWDTMKMPIGHADGSLGTYMSEQQSTWQEGVRNDETFTENSLHNTNYWIRRNFEMDAVDPNTSYALNVCHDDNYQTYVNGHLLQENTGWTTGKNPVQVHIPGAYLNAGKNVIATYIQQNWGGCFYDCGINTEEVNYEESLAAVENAIKLAQNPDVELTDAMYAALDDLIAEAEDYIATNTDAAEMKIYAEELTDEINTILGYSADVVALRMTIEICQGTTDNGYGLGDAVAAAKAGFQACANGDEISELLDPLRAARKRNNAERRTEEFTGSAFAPNTKYYIYNVGEKRFLGGDGDWGTHCAVTYVSNEMMFIPDTSGETDGYAIDTDRYNGSTYHFLNYNGYLDVYESYWSVEAVAGKSNVYTIYRTVGENPDNADGRYYLGYCGGDNATGLTYDLVDTDMNSPELESNQWMFITRDELNDLMYYATEENPVDASHLIGNPNFDQRLAIDGYWVGLSDAEGEGVWGRGERYDDFAYEGYNSTNFELFQEIYDDALIPGWYSVGCTGFYRDGSYEHAVEKYLAGESIDRLAYINVQYDYDNITYLRSITDNSYQVPGIGRVDDTGTVCIPDNTIDAADGYFKLGLYKAQLLFELDNEGELYFAIDKEGGEVDDWVVVDNFRLVYYGTSEPTGIESVEMVEELAPTSAVQGVYNLNGQKLSAPVKGVNIINGRKVVVK